MKEKIFLVESWFKIVPVPAGLESFPGLWFLQRKEG